MADELWVETNGFHTRGFTQSFRNRRWEAKNAWSHFRKPIDSVKNAAHVSNVSSFTLSEAGWQRTRTSVWFCSVLIQTCEEWEWVFGNVQEAARTPARRGDDPGRCMTAAGAQNRRSLNLYLLESWPKGEEKKAFLSLTSGGKLPPPILSIAGERFAVVVSHFCLLTNRNEPRPNDVGAELLFK